MLKHDFKYIKICAAVTAVAMSPFIMNAMENYNAAGVFMKGVSAIEAFASEPAVAASSSNITLYKPASENYETEEVIITTAAPSEIETMPEPMPKEFVISQNIAETHEDLSVYTGKDGIVKEKTIHGSGLFRNITSDVPDELLTEESVKSPDFKIVKDTAEPQVLIIHTHTTESYRVSDSLYYDAEYDARTFDAGKSVVAVGEAIAQSLAENGIAVIHDGTVHDVPYTGAYDRSRVTVQRILAQYPSVKSVLDIHRDAVEETDDDGTPVRVSAVTEIEGKQAAQIMIIAQADAGGVYANAGGVYADGGGYSVPDYLQNFRFACMLQRHTTESYGELARPILFEHCGYNQDLSHGALLVEVGSHGNTLAEAVYAGKLFGKSFAETV